VIFVGAGIEIVVFVIAFVQRHPCRENAGGGKVF